MQLPLYTINAFADEPFTGNPAAVCPLREWLDDTVLQAIAAQNNLSETAFFVQTAPGDFQIRWFTPTVEVPLCGHATLAAAYVLKSIQKEATNTIRFHSKSGPLTVTASGEQLTLDFPSQAPKRTRTPSWFVNVFGANPTEFLESSYCLAIFPTQEIVAALEPDFSLLARQKNTTVIVSAPGNEHDFVSRYFAPCDGIDEDQVTGSAHCILTPYWAKRLNRNVLHARQISRRGGELTCELKGERVLISGRAMLYGQGSIHI